MFTSQVYFLPPNNNNKITPQSGAAERRIETGIAYQLLYCLHWTKNMLKTRKNIRVTKYQKSDKFNITV